MAGLYLHIPFCGGTRCLYCDFYSTTTKGKGVPYVGALLQELKERLWHDGWSTQRFRTVYLGGGTPSQIPGATLKQLLTQIGQLAEGSRPEEVTLEANPEDVSPHFLKGLFKTNQPESPWSVNRVSLGVQSLDDAELARIGRRHDSRKVEQAVGDLRQRGVSNISIDLMYGLPGQTMTTWRETISRALALDVEHISAYCLTVEPRTPLASLLERGALQLPTEEEVLQMAEHLRFRLAKAGYVQYEISNFAKPGFESKHNSAYWTGEPYLGLGSGAHSYDGVRTRTWNAPHLEAYMSGRCEREEERLSAHDLYNERIMLGLRTRQGVDLAQLSDWLAHRPDDLSENEALRLAAHFESQRASLTDRGIVTVDDGRLRLTAAGLALADVAIRELFWV